MRDSWRVWRRAIAAAPAVSATVGVLVVLNTLLLILTAVFVSRAVGVAASGGGQALVAPLVALMATLVGTALTVALLPPACLRLERAIVLDQVGDVIRRAARAESSRAAGGGEASTLGAVAERVVSIPHREALSSVADLLRTRCRGWAGVFVLGLVSPIAAVVLAASIVAYGRAFTRFLDDVLAGLASKGPLATRRARYVRSLHFEHGIAGELRTFGALPWLLGRFVRLSDEGRAEAFHGRQRHVKAVAGYALLCAVALLGCLSWLGVRAWSGDLGVAEFALCVQGALLMLDLGPAGDVAVRFRQAARVERDLGPGAGASPARPVASVAAATTEVAVACRSVRYVYPGAERAALDVPELTIRRGERVAVVGRNGAGKSTLFGVIAGFLKPTDGSVDVDPAGASIAIQQPVRYPATLRDNVSLGHHQVDVDHALAIVGLGGGDGLALERAGELLAGPSMGGGDLSGGQWQRVGLARAFGHATAGVLLLDEPSAALDPAAEEEFFRTALDEAHGCTVLLSTHHLANTRFVDRIVVLDGGRIVQDGTHADLLSSGGLYADLFVAQAKAYGVRG